MNNFLKFVVLLCVPICAKAQIPTATIVTSGSTVCANASLTFSALTSNTPTTYLWKTNPTTSVTIFPDNSLPSVTITFGRAGVHSVSLTVSNATGSTTVVRNITVIQNANASFNASLTTYGYPNQLVLTNYSTNYIKNYWIFSHIPGLPGKDSTNNTSMTYSASGAYTVLLVAVGNNGCNDTLPYRFFISDSSGVNAPTIFTPNGDGVNDIFRPTVRGVTELKGWVYNRFGTIICSWDKVNGFWDGYTTSGEPCQDGVYFYIVEAIGFDGKSYKIKNTVTLIR
ncbi:MAG: gliding motility-associated C-terminal domain [Bacteroidetes bacterium]|jgi:gliding motility-associated-like protein|nr:gliding motility-associated C-terminal domain [Bacteroidota bacterium]